MATDLPLDMLYEALAENPMAQEYHERHDIRSACILTVYDDETAHLIAERLGERFRGKTLIEIGGGIGLLGCHLAPYLKHLYVIEADPGWTWAFLGCMYAKKPPNLTFIFGKAEEVVGAIKGDAAFFCTHSAAGHLRRLGEQFAPEVIDVYGEIVGKNELRTLEVPRP